MKNNKGFSLVELLVAFAIAAIAGVAVFGFMSAGSNQFTNTTEDLGLQYEQQVAINQLKTMIMNTSSALVYTGPAYNAPDETVTPEVTPGVTPAPASTDLPVLTIFNQDLSGATPEYEVVVYELRKADEADETGVLYKRSKKYSAIADIDKTAAGGSEGVLAEDVSAFAVDLSKVKKDKVYFTVTFKRDDKEIKVEEVVALRNRIMAAGDINDVDFSEVFSETSRTEIESFISSISILRDDNVIPAGSIDSIKILNSGEMVIKYDYEIKVVEGSKLEYDGVVWSFDTTPPNGVTLDSATGAITIDGAQLNLVNNAKRTMTLRATSTKDTSKYTYIVVELSAGGVYPVNVVVGSPTMTGSNGTRIYTFPHVVVYTDGSTTSSDDLVEWKCMTKLPTGCVMDGNKLTLNSNANDLPIKVRCTVKKKDARNELVFGEYTVTPSGIPEFIVGTEMKLTVADIIDRNNTFNSSISWVNSSSARFDYSWKVEPVNPQDVEGIYNELAAYVEEQQNLVKEYQENVNPLKTVTYDTNYANQGLDSIKIVYDQMKNGKVTLASWNTGDERDNFGEILYFGTKSKKEGSTFDTSLTKRNASLYCKSYLNWSNYYLFRVTCTAKSHDYQPSDKKYETYTSVTYALIRPVRLTMKTESVVRGETDPITRSSQLDTDPVLAIGNIESGTFTIRRAVSYAYENIRITGLEQMSSMDSPARWVDNNYGATAKKNQPAFVQMMTYRGNMFYDSSAVRFYDFNDWADRSMITLDFGIDRFYAQSYWPDKYVFRLQARDGKGNVVTSSNSITYYPNMTKIHPNAKYQGRPLTIQDVKNYYKKN